MRGKQIAAAVVAIGVVVPHCGAIAAEQVGEATRIRNQVSATVGGALAVSSPVFRSETVTAGPASLGELRLSDDSKVLVGENSSVALDDFVVGEGGFGRASIKVAKGALRFISGDSKKGAFKVKTPVSSIGVRGTFFDVYVADSGETRVVLLHGRVDVCGTAGGCVVASQPCDVVHVSASGRVEREPFFLSRERSIADTRRNFPLLGLQARYSPAYWAPVTRCSGRALLEIPRKDGDGNTPEESSSGY